LELNRSCSDAAIVMGCTMQDLTDIDRGYNFLFGQANFSSGCGAFSFARYRDDHPSGSEFLRRCCMVLCHEIGHLFGFAHCVYCSCLMSGSNHLQEAASRPLCLCPADMIKLQVGGTRTASAMHCCLYFVSFDFERLHLYSQPPLQLALVSVGGVDLVARQLRLTQFFAEHSLWRDAGLCHHFIVAGLLDALLIQI
jgi:hypothetical protein